MHVLETVRLRLRHLTPDDAAFILELVNDPDWLRFIGDRGVRSLDGARDYILRGPVASYARLGFGLFLVELRAGGEATGICGLIKRDTLEDVDIGYAFLPRYRGRGYALEASRAALAYGRDALGLRRIVAITDPDNDASARLLGRLGLEFSRMIIPPGETRELKLFAWNA